MKKYNCKMLLRIVHDLPVTNSNVTSPSGQKNCLPITCLVLKVSIRSFFLHDCPKLTSIVSEIAINNKVLVVTYFLVPSIPPIKKRMKRQQKKCIHNKLQRLYVRKEHYRSP